MKLRNIVVLGMLMLLGACSSMPLSTMFKMVKLNPLELDPAQLVVAVAAPKAVEVADGDVVIDFSFQAPDPAVSFRHHFLVKVDEAYPVPQALQDEADDNEQVSIMHLSKDDAAIMRQAQQTVKTYRESHQDGAGSINVRLVSVCQRGSGSLKDAEVNLYLKTQANEDFFLFLKNLDASQLRGDLPSNAAPLYCGNAS